MKARRAIPPKVGADGTAAATVPSAVKGMSNFFELLRHELTEPLETVIELAGRIEGLRQAGLLPATLGGEQTFLELADTSRRSAGFVRRLMDLGDFLIDSPIVDDERLQLEEAAESAAIAVAALASERNIGLRLMEGEERMAPIYGSRRWIVLALQLLLEGLIRTAPAGTHVLLRQRQVGLHQLVSGSIQHAWPKTGSRDLLGEVRGLHPDGLAGVIDRASLDLALAHAILEMHGGMFKIETTETGHLNQFSFTLPTSLPARESRRTRCNICPVRQQSMQYASDLATLMETCSTPA